MAEYIAEKRLALTGGIVEEGSAFKSDAVPGQHWIPQDKEAKAAVKDRDAAKSDAPVVLKAGSGEPDPRIAELETALKEAGELAELRDAENDQLRTDLAEARAVIAKFDGDGDGKPGGSKPAQ